MAKDPISFTDNYQDLSTDNGFQFKFNCERCGNGYMSTFQKNITGMAGDALRAASGIFGGVLGRAANSAYDVQKMIGGPQHDAALRKATEELRDLFNQCKRCGQWVCTEVCWNNERSLCVGCAPHMAQEISQIESEATIQQLRQKAYNDTDLTGGVNFTSAAAKDCPSCGTSLPAGTKFCSECGANTLAKPTCAGCGAEAVPGAKFCGECGAKF